MTKVKNLPLWCLSFFVLLKLALPFILINPVYELHRDEYLHLDQARHMAWGFQSVPPLSSVFAYLIMLLGGGVFWVRLISASIGAATLIFTWKIVEELNGGLYARVLSAVALLACAIARLDLLFQPNAFDILSWTAVYFFLLKYLHTGKSWFIYVVALAFAIGFLNKYSIVFLLAGLTPALAISSQRVIFRSKHLYYGALMALLIVTPNLIWQYQNDFPVVRHMKELSATQLDKINRFDFLKEQLLYYIGILFILVAAFVGIIRHRPFRNHSWVALSFMFTLALFTWFRSKGYYAAGLYPVLVAFGSVYLGLILDNGWKRYLKIVVLLLPVLVYLLTFRFAYPVLKPQQIVAKSEIFKKVGLLRWEDGLQHDLPQDFADMLGWKELAHQVDSIYRSFPDPEHTLVICNNYGEAGAINYYSDFKQINAVSFSTDYVNWFQLDKKIKHIIAVKEKENDKDIPPGFVKAGEVRNKFAREYGTVIYVLRETDLDYNKILRERIEKIRNK
ncbi:Dolichyl-phosphate-mannose-protein mannosyltransferase [Pedobacter steynii]|uniref:Dolichyl-phosphate-mannose-protein mannosyltransferase n=1 Tax=Pedobacter steynii TaxID=430522 RepID=A0A1H0AE79_9SPHI|nr:glycosyltransferase family 39 protein [Pedobacter steynii]NQX41390.1 glycosyltransferase family 39 protein [Pedobacter steynii]SDN31634.1 Dolichyl-phosphate-mannose-protein mannosyltransferase [Pedobacter steynii]